MNNWLKVLYSFYINISYYNENLFNELIWIINDWIKIRCIKKLQLKIVIFNGNN